MKTRTSFGLTPWNNDPVCDRGGEAYYLRDEESGIFLVADAAAEAGRDAICHPARIRLQRI